MKSRLIVNPVAGRDAAADFLQQLNERLRTKFGMLDIVMTTGPGDATDAAAQAAQLGYDCVFSAGGDGTLNEVLNGVATVDGALEAITLGVIPLGTGNDFSATLGLSADADRATEEILKGKKRTVDLGGVAGQFFVNTSAGGFIADVSEAVNPQLKSLAGRLAYIIGGAQVLWSFDPVEAKFELETDQGRVQHEASLQLFAVCNAPTLGGGRPIAPHASIDDGWLDLCMIETMPAADFIALLAAISRGEHLADRRVSYFRILAAKFRFGRSIRINTDGEVLEVSQCDYAVHAGAAHFFSAE